MDVSIPTLLDQTFAIEPLNEDDGSRSVPQTSIAKPEAKPEDENDKVQQRILVLEAEVEKSNKSATESRHELSKEKLRRLDLENRIEELELALELEEKKIYQNDDKSILDVQCYERLLEIAKKERDDALDLLREIRKLMVKT